MSDSRQRQPAAGTAWSRYGLQDFDEQPYAQPYAQPPYAQPPYAPQPSYGQPWHPPTRQYAHQADLAQHAQQAQYARPTYVPPQPTYLAPQPTYVPAQPTYVAPQPTYQPRPTPQGAPAGWGPPPVRPSHGRRNLLIALAAAVVVAAVAVTIVLATRTSPPNDAVQQVPATSAGSSAHPGGARPFPDLATPTTQAPATQAPTIQAPTTQAPTTQAPTTDQAPAGGGDLGAGAANTTAKAFAAAVTAHDLSAVQAQECQALVVDESQSDIDSITGLSITSAPVVTGHTATVAVYVSDGADSGAATMHMLVENGAWKMCRG